jgi:hypothetical protein
MSNHVSVHPSASCFPSSNMPKSVILKTAFSWLIVNMGLDREITGSGRN